jgi:hypothetical protein
MTADAQGAALGKRVREISEGLLPPDELRQKILARDGGTSLIVVPIDDTQDVAIMGELGDVPS